MAEELKRKDEGLKERMNEWLNKWKNKFKYMNDRIKGLKDEWINQWMKELMNEWMNLYLVCWTRIPPSSKASLASTSAKGTSSS